MVINKSKDLVKKFSEREVKENFVPVDERDVQRSIDVLVKERKIEEIEEVGTKIKEKKAVIVKKKSSKKNNEVNFSLKKPMKLKEGGPILIITEKPQAAQKIASSLSEKSILKESVNGVPYYNIQKGGEKIQVVCAVGHLFSLAQVNKRNIWPTFEINWFPN